MRGGEMTQKQVDAKIQQIIKRAKKNGVNLFKNNISKAKPVNRICGVMKSRVSLSTEDLLCR
jgi:hypothetical protein